jgi:arylformamidase
VAVNERSSPPPWIDISVPIRPGVPIFEGDPAFHIELAASMAAGAICNVSRLDLGAHTGTHLDAPRHFIDGAPATESISLDDCIGPAWVVDATALSRTVGAADIAALDIPSGQTRLLFKTPNSELWGKEGFQSGFIGLDGGAAAVLVERGVRLVGIDYLSIAPFGDPVATHQTLLTASVVILEGIDLRNVEPGPVDLLCLPIRLIGSDGVPARALVRPRRGHQDVTEAV